MKILVITTMYPNSKYYMSGVFIHEQVKSLKKLGVEVEVFALIPWVPPLLKRFKEKWRKLKTLSSIEKIEGVIVFHPKYLALPGGLFKHLWPYICFMSMKIFARKNHIHFNEFDLIHAQGGLPEDYTAYLLSRSTRLPYVLTVHGATVYATVKRKKHFEKSKKVIENADFVIAVSHKVKEKILKFTNRKDKISVIYNGFNRIYLPEKKNHEKTILLFGASLVERKGLKYLLNAFSVLEKEFRRTELWIAGGGPLLDFYKKSTVKLQIQNKVKFWGPVAHDKMLKLMNESDIFILPSWDEAFGVVYLEAMSFKKPIIGTIGEGISEIIVNGINGLLVKPKDEVDLVEKIRLLLKNERLRKTIGLNGAETVQKLTWGKNANENKKLYELVLKTRKQYEENFNAAPKRIPS